MTPRSAHAASLRAPTRAAIACAALVAAIAACRPADNTPRAHDDPDREPDAGVDASCPAPSLGGLDLQAVESEPGYDDELAALDLDALPASIPLDTISDTQRALVLYMLDVRTADALDRDATATTDLGRAVLGAFAAAVDPGTLDFTFLRRGLFRFYGCGRGFPPTVADLRADVFDYTSDTHEVVDSDVKNLRRRISRSASAGAFIAETLRDDDSVRETEVILSDRRADGRLDFLEYGEDGALRGASQFATSSGAQVIGAVPYTCTTCHEYTNVSPEIP